ncbi:MAG: T9SS type A sorting domain-containing protein [candidate division WOR-3 bacterium]
MRVTPTCDPLGSAFYIYYDGPIPAQYAPEITFGGGNYFVVWHDYRNNIYQIYGARVTPGGSVLDPTGIQISIGTSQYYYYPSVTWGGTRYFVVWGVYTPAPYHVYGRFVNPDGSMASDTLQLASASAAIYNVDVAYSGTNFMVIWNETSSPYTLKGLLVSNTGVPIGSPFTIASPVYYFKSSRVVFDGINYLVTYSYQVGGIYQLWGVKYNTSGLQVGSAFRISPSTNNIYYADVVPGANNRYLNVWSEYISSQYDIRGNIDIEIVGVEETEQEGISKIKIPSIIKKDIVLPEFSGKTVYLYDASGRNIARTDNGYFDFSKLRSGVYFIRLPEAVTYKVIKIE